MNMQPADASSRRARTCQREPQRVVADGRFVVASARDLDGNLLVARLRMVFTKGTAPEQAVRALRAGDRLRVYEYRGWISLRSRGECGTRRRTRRFSRSGCRMRSLFSASINDVEGRGEWRQAVGIGRAGGKRDVFTSASSHGVSRGARGRPTVLDSARSAARRRRSKIRGTPELVHPGGRAPKPRKQSTDSLCRGQADFSSGHRPAAPGFVVSFKTRPRAQKIVGVTGRGVPSLICALRPNAERLAGDRRNHGR